MDQAVYWLGSFILAVCGREMVGLLINSKLYHRYCIIYQYSFCSCISEMNPDISLITSYFLFNYRLKSLVCRSGCGSQVPVTHLYPFAGCSQLHLELWWGWRWGWGGVWCPDSVPMFAVGAIYSLFWRLFTCSSVLLIIKCSGFHQDKVVVVVLEIHVFQVKRSPNFKIHHVARP